MTEDDKRIYEAYTNDECPNCKTGLSSEGYHERDSTYDRFFCKTCDFEFQMFHLWAIEEEVRRLGL